MHETMPAVCLLFNPISIYTLFQTNPVCRVCFVYPLMPLSVAPLPLLSCLVLPLLRASPHTRAAHAGGWLFIQHVPAPEISIKP